MVQWVKFAVRLVAAFFLGGIGAMTLLSCTWAGRGWWWIAAVGVAMIAASWMSWPRRPNAWRRDPPTDRQIAYAIDLGIAIPPGASKGELSDLISQAKGR